MKANSYTKTEKEDNRTSYEKSIQDRSLVHYIIGLLIRWKQNIKYSYIRYVARKHGATIGKGVIIPLSLAKRANKNLTVGNHVCIATDLIDLRSPVTIGNHVIINRGCEILTTSHHINSLDYAHKYYGIEIEDYVWLATKSLILPSCRHIRYGSIIGAGSVVTKDTEAMDVIGGYSTVIKKRKEVHKNLIVESLLGGDLHS